MNIWKTDDYEDRYTIFMDWETADNITTDVDGVSIQIPEWALQRLIQTYHEENA